MKMRMFGCFILTTLISLMCYPVAFAAKATQTEKFVSISDIHFNPFSSCKSALQTCPTLNKLRATDYKEWDTIFIQSGEEQHSKLGQDTNYPLLASTMETLLELNQKEKFQFGVVLGDFLAHNFRMKYMLYSHDASTAGYQAFVKKTMQFITDQLHQSLPDVDLYTALGNNDSYTGDYSSVPHGEFYQDTAKALAGLIHNPNNKKQLLHDFPTAGYYAVTLPNTNQRLILLNTVLFSNHANGSNDAAKAELTWLHEQLVLADQKKQRVILAFHISPGVDVHTTVKSRLGKVEEFWKPEYQATFMNELTHYAPIITAILPGHIHMDAFQLVKVTEKMVLPVNFTPGVSPIFGNNPGFKVFSYNPKNLKMENFSTYFLPLGKDTGWQQEYSFNHFYQPKCKNCELVQGMKKLTPTNELAQHYKQFYALGNNAQPITQHNDWMPYYWCGLQEVNVDNYKQCVKEGVVG